MVAGFHERSSFRLSRQSSDASCLSFSVVNDEDDAADIKPEVYTMKRPRQRSVTFNTRARIIPIPSFKCLEQEEKEAMFMSNDELLSIRLELRALVTQNDNDRLSGSEDALDESNEILRGLEVYTRPGKVESSTRRGIAFDAVFHNQKKGRDEERIAAEYAKISAKALERARKLALQDQERAWSTEELERFTRPPMNQIMDR
ncbi:hypothetical protein IV203_029965 [Nitzschia inconspicua]|uniref:Uncharacterized protein n=1 Tax=Nitzschia inconspicua TaxID=303405 RepID=A0A9K3LRQ3_9STRA|nr:hypothetical protein IV203_029965 [Nitzschia inconspicua]